MQRLFILLLLALIPTGYSLRQQAPAPKSHYETRSNHDPDGTGRFYLGREIALVMGHEGAAWLERPDRALTELPDYVVKEMELRATDHVADVGAGTGYFTFRLSKAVPAGKVFAIDIQREMLDLIEQRKRSLKADNVVSVLGTEMDVRLPEEIDAALLVDAYHEFLYPREMMESLVKRLKPGGRIFLVEYRGEDPEVPIKPVHKMTLRQVRIEMNAVGLTVKEVKSFLPYQHFIVLQKAAGQ